MVLFWALPGKIWMLSVVSRFSLPFGLPQAIEKTNLNLLKPQFLQCSNFNS